MYSFCVAGVDSVMLYFGEGISQSVAKRVRQSFNALKNAELLHVIEIVPSYTSIMVSYDFMAVSYEEICEEIDRVLSLKDGLSNDFESSVVTIPVYYGVEVGLDLEELCEMKSMSLDEIVSLHVGREYFVYAIGFSPGFPYMGEVDELLATPRLANPRAKVPKGSVGIAQKQTAIYPQLSPGGWRILGRTPLEMFDASRDGFSYLKVGDRVKFKPINRDEFLELGGEL